MRGGGGGELGPLLLSKLSGVAGQSYTSYLQTLTQKTNIQIYYIFTFKKCK